jgi:hypothetical protein
MDFAAWTMRFQIMSKIDILNIWFTLKMHFIGLSIIININGINP